jgi:hypothetical protein
MIWSAVASLGLYVVVLGGLVWLRAGRGVTSLLARLPGRMRDKAAGLWSPSRSASTSSATRGRWW